MPGINKVGMIVWCGVNCYTANSRYDFWKVECRDDVQAGLRDDLAVPWDMPDFDLSLNPLPLTIRITAEKLLPSSLPEADISPDDECPSNDYLYKIVRGLARFTSHTVKASRVREGVTSDVILEFQSNREIRDPSKYLEALSRRMSAWAVA